MLVNSLRNIVRFILLLAVNTVCAQSYVPGQSYFSEHNYIEYIPGTLPIIISVPHGGYLEPTSIPDRTCGDAVYTNDANTQELSRDIIESIYATFGCYPHVVINHLHRSKLDANRNLFEGACGNDSAVLAWTDFNRFLDTAVAEVLDAYGRGFYIDLHGHGHTIQRLELGYLLYTDELQLDDATLNNDPYLSYSSIQFLASDNSGDLTHAELLRGAFAFGTLMAENGYPSVPSQSDPYPATDDPYFSGGYNTAERSSYNGGFIDGVQIECNMNGIRNSADNRQKFADTLASVLRQYLLLHMFSDAELPVCTPVSLQDHEQLNNFLSILTQPVQETVLVNCQADFLVIQSLTGARIAAVQQPHGLVYINMQHAPSGMYVAQATAGGISRSITFVKL